MSITEKEVNFKDLEEKIFKEVCSLGCAMLKGVLEEMDLELQNTRDKSEYRNKGKRKTTIKTVMGEVEFERTVYEIYDESGMTGQRISHTAAWNVVQALGQKVGV